MVLTPINNKKKSTVNMGLFGFSNTISKSDWRDIDGLYHHFVWIQTDFLWGFFC